MFKTVMHKSYYSFYILHGFKLLIAVFAIMVYSPYQITGKEIYHLVLLMHSLWRMKRFRIMDNMVISLWLKIYSCSCIMYLKILAAGASSHATCLCYWVGCWSTQ